MYKYWGYAMNIASELPLPELVPAEFNTDPELVIRIGETPEFLQGEDVVTKVNAWIRPGQYLLRVGGIAAYHATNGNEIVVTPAPGAQDESVRLFMFSNAMAAILYQRNLLPLHASAVLINGELTLFAGVSGAGKSTMAAMLGNAGFDLFSDDVCIINPQAIEGRICASACYPSVKLWDESIHKLGIEKSTGFQLRPHFEKYAFHFHAQFRKGFYPVRRIFLLETSALTSEVSCEKIDSAIAVFSELQKHAYRKLQLNAMKKRQQLFSTLGQLATQCEVFRITRPRKTDSLNDLRSIVVPLLDRMESSGQRMHSLFQLSNTRL